MKTAIDNLIIKLENGFLENKLNTSFDIYNLCIESKEEEKQQIIDAYHDGQEHGFNKFGDDAEKYFEDTFNLKQEL